MEYKEKHNVKYSCGCVHEIGLTDGMFWSATGHEANCEKHR